MNGPYFVAKFETTGELLWTNDPVGSLSEHRGADICIDHTGSVIITGTSGLLVKFSPAGQPLWERTIGDADGCTVSIDLEGNILTAGFFSGSVIFGDTRISAIHYRDIYLVKHSADGAVLWSRLISSDEIYDPLNLQSDINGNIYISGRFCNDVDFSGHLLSTTACGTFLTKYNSGGQVLWSTYFE